MRRGYISCDVRIRAVTRRAGAVAATANAISHAAIYLPLSERSTEIKIARPSECVAICCSENAAGDFNLRRIKLSSSPSFKPELC